MLVNASYCPTLVHPFINLKTIAYNCENNHNIKIAISGIMANYTKLPPITSVERIRQQRLIHFISQHCKDSAPAML